MNLETLKKQIEQLRAEQVQAAINLGIVTGRLTECENLLRSLQMEQAVTDAKAKTDERK